MERRIYSVIQSSICHIQLAKKTLNNKQEKGLSSFENCEVDVLTVYPNQQNGQPSAIIYKNAIVKFIDDFVVINDEMLVPKNNILRIKKIEV